MKTESSKDGSKVEAGEAEEAAQGLPAVGSRSVTRARTITEGDVTMFAALTGDRHPQHTDAEWARTSMFGERIAHGLLVLSFALGLEGLDPSRVVALRRLRNVVFKRPTRIGDTIHAQITVAATQVVNEGTSLVRLDWVVANAREETLVRASIDVLWRTSTPLPPGEEFYDRDIDLPDGFVPC